MSMMERLARVLRDDIGRQWNAHPIPGDANPASWTATGGALELEECVRAILTELREPSDDLGYIGIAAAERYDGWDGQMKPGELQAAFTAMIDAILEGKA